jgi:N-dimethylarginine dimethylaminohydrolase
MEARRDDARILMCAPEHFAVTYRINPWMDPMQWDAQSNTLGLQAHREWKRLHQRLLQLGATVELVPPVADLPDLVFTANAAVVMDGVALVARFRHPERQPEEAYFERSFRELWARGVISAVRTMPEGVCLEGAGDCVWDKSRQMFWMGYGPRSDRDAARVVTETFGLETAALELVDPRFYHMDTALSALPHGEIMYVPSAFDADGLRQIHDRTTSDQRIELSPKDAAVFAANSVWIGDQVVMSGASAGLRRQLEGRGYRVHATSLGTFHRSGGSAFCLTLRLDHRSESAALRQVS